MQEKRAVFHPRPPNSHNLIYDWGILSSSCQKFSNVWLLAITKYPLQGHNRLISTENIDFVVDRQNALMYSSTVHYGNVVNWNVSNICMWTVWCRNNQVMQVQYLIGNQIISDGNFTQNRRYGATWTSFHVKMHVETGLEKIKCTSDSDFYHQWVNMPSRGTSAICYTQTGRTCWKVNLAGVVWFQN